MRGLGLGGYERKISYCWRGALSGRLLALPPDQGGWCARRSGAASQQWAMLNVDSVPYAWGRGWMGEGRVGDSLAEVIREVGQ